MTLGWITCTIFGAMYLVGPMALRCTIVAGRRDVWAFACVTIGVVGMVGHFWIAEYAGMLWAAGTLLLGAGLVAARVLPALLGAPIQAGVRLHLLFAWINLFAAGVWGALVGLSKVGGLALPGFLLANVYAHAHTAALGWATMVALGVGYRLLPMYLPAAMPQGRLLACPLLLQAGVWILVPSLVLDAGTAWLGAALILAALGVYARDVARMLRSPRRPPAALPRPDLARWHMLSSLLYLVLACAAGLLLLALPRSVLELRVAFLYGVFGLLGFLGQLIVGVAARLLPAVVWLQLFHSRRFEPPTVSVHRIFDRSLQTATFLLWNVGVPALAVGLFRASTTVVAAAALALACALLADGANRLLLVRALLGGADRPRLTSAAAPAGRSAPPPGS